MDVTFVHGAMATTYEQQANRQGLTLGNKAELAEDLRHAILTLMFNNILTDAQRWNAFQRLQKKVLIPNLTIKEQNDD